MAFDEQERETAMSDRILRLPDVKSFTGVGRSTLYVRVGQGLFPRPIPIGPRMVGWLESEVTAINAARVRGSSDEEIRSLVAELETARRSAA
jgi:prophage regulatory protein